MAHNLDNSKGFYAFVANGASAWHGLGTIMKDAISTDDALKKGGLDFTVIKLPNIHLLPNKQEIISETSFFTVRLDTNKVLGSKLGADYEVMQNIEALNVVDEILQSGNATIETAGAIDEGRKVFICLKINKDIIVGSTDVVSQYVLIVTSHDGSLSITAMPTNNRVVCRNTLSAALSGKHDKIKIRHTANAAERLREAAKVLNLIHTNTDVNTDQYNKMREFVISKQEMWNYFGNIFCDEDEIKAFQSGKKITDVLSTRKQNTIAGVLNYALNGQGQSIAMQGNDFTMWSAYNAVTGYISRRKYNNASDRANNLLFGTAATTIERAGKLALTPDKVQVLSRNNFNDLNLN